MRQCKGRDGQLITKLDIGIGIQCATVDLQFVYDYDGCVRKHNELIWHEPDQSARNQYTRWQRIQLPNDPHIVIIGAVNILYSNSVTMYE